MMTQRDFIMKCEAAEAGNRFVYYTGLLMFDQKNGANFMAIKALQVAAFNAMESGVVRLYQRKLGASSYDYIAEKLPAPYKPVEWLGCYASDKYTNYKRPSRREPGEMAAFVAGTRLARETGAAAHPHA